MATKSKTYNQIKYPYDVIDQAYKEFLKSLDPKNKKNLHRTWEIENVDAKWALDSENQFISEYVKDEILEASFLCFDLGDIKFSVSFSNRSYDKPNTRVSISLDNREKIEKIFGVFETSYSEFIEKSKAVHKGNSSNSQITSQYTYKKNLPSVFVDKKLLVDLEHYILQRGPQLDSRKKQILDYTVTIIDSAGTLSLQNIESYPREIFDNETEAVTLSYGKSYENIKIYLRFEKSRDRAEIEISYKGENAHEVVESLKVGIYQQLKDSKTWNFIYHPHFAITALLIYPLLIILGATLYAVYKTRVWSQQGIAATLLLAIYLIAPYFKPYITFDTRRNILIRKWSGWLIESLMGILLIWLVASLFPALVP